jgi:hypothetical protein
MSRIAILGLSSGIFFVLATLIAVALLNLPHSAGAAVVDGALVPCPLAEVSLDQGYGVTRTALRPVCTGQATHALAEKRAPR